MPSKLSFVSLSTSALLMLRVLTITMTTTNAYAQPQGRGNSQACPEGFTLNRGVCQAEPEPTCENYNVVQERVSVDENGDCILREYTTAVCLNEEGTRILGYYFPGNDCIDTSTKEIIPDAEPECKDPTNPNHAINTADLTTERGTIECVFTTNIGPADLECDIGTLNEDSEMCEVRPGNRGGNRA
jgi:hypothetical protein